MPAKQFDPCNGCDLADRIELLEQAFPDGPIPHREAHKAWMDAKRAEKEFWQALKLDIAQKGVWGLLIILMGLLILGISTKLGFTPHV